MEYYSNRLQTLKRKKPVTLFCREFLAKKFHEEGNVTRKLNKQN